MNCISWDLASSREPSIAHTIIEQKMFDVDSNQNVMEQNWTIIEINLILHQNLNITPILEFIVESSVVIE